MSHLHAPPPMAPSTPSQSGADDDVIPTAIVIKNIPFNVKRETLLDIIVRGSFLSHHDVANSRLEHSPRCQSRPPTLSTTTLTSRARSVDWHLLISACLPTPMRSSQA